jgi:alanine dehydrogenase
MNFILRYQTISCKEGFMLVGVPKEIKTHEYRVGLTPGAVREYVSAGHNVIVETNAGRGIGAGDDFHSRQ